MNSFEHYMGNPLVKVPDPDNWMALELELSFENNSPEAILNNTKLVWKADNARRINDWVQAGVSSGGVGIFEGIPYQVRVCNSQELVFDGIIDPTDSETKFTCDIVQVRIRDKRMDMVSQLFDSIGFAYLATPVSEGGAGIINPAPTTSGGDYVVIPYQRNDIPDYVQLFVMGLAIYEICDKINDISTRLSSMITGDIAASADVVGGEDGTLYGLFDIIGYILYIVLLLILVFEMLKACFNYLVSPVFTKFGMYAKDLMAKACQYFGIGFSSSIMQSAPFDQLVIMPSKSAWSDNRTFTQTLFANVIGGSTINQRMEYDDLYNWQHNGTATNLGAYGYYDGTVGDFFRAMGEVFNAKAKIIFNTSGQPVLHFERWDYIYNLASYQLPNISDQTPFNSNGLFNTTGQSQSAFATNAAEVPSNYEVRYQRDDSDVNTYNAYEGTSCYCTTRPVAINITRNILLQNLVQKNLSFAHAFRKDQNTTPEIVLQPIWSAAATIYNLASGLINGFINVYNFIANLFGAPPIPTLSQIPTTPPFFQLNHMLLTNHITGVPKMFIAGPPQIYGSLPFFSDWNGRSFTGVTVDPNNRDLIGAKVLMKNFHFSNLPQTVVPASPYNLPYVAGSTYYNQYLVYKEQQVPLCCSEYEAIKNNNIILTFDGRQARADSIKWNPFKGMARIDYRIKQQYTKNLQTSFVIDGKIVASAL